MTLLDKRHCTLLCLPSGGHIDHQEVYFLAKFQIFLVKIWHLHLARAAEDIDAECARYTRLLEEYPTDIVCLGIGENGHIAFNDPWIAQFNDEAMIKKVPLDEVCRMQQVHDGCFPELEKVPAHALSLTIPALTCAKAMFCTVPARTKREAVTRTVNERISEDCPATIMRLHDYAVMYCDKDSGADLL